jgi:hypothetical protein
MGVYELEGYYKVGKSPASFRVHAESAKKAIKQLEADTMGDIKIIKSKIIK